MAIDVGQVREDGTGRRRLHVVEVLADYAVVEFVADPDPVMVGAQMSFGFEQLSAWALVDGD